MCKLKKCTKCNEEFPFDEYGNDPKTSDGKRTQCPTCYSIYQAQYWMNYRRKNKKGPIVKKEKKKVPSREDKELWRKAKQKKKKLLESLGGKFLKYINKLNTTLRVRSTCLGCRSNEIVPYDQLEKGQHWELFCHDCEISNNSLMTFRSGNIPKKVIQVANHMIKLVSKDRTLTTEQYIELANKKYCVRCERKSIPMAPITYYSQNTKEMPGILCVDCKEFYDRWTKIPSWGSKPVQHQCKTCNKFQDPEKIKGSKCLDCSQPKKKKEKLNKHIIKDEYGNVYVDYSDPEFVKYRSIKSFAEKRWRKIEAKERGEIVLCLYCDGYFSQDKMHNEDMCNKCKKKSSSIVW